MKNIYYDSQKDKFIKLCLLAENTLKIPNGSLASSSRQQQIVDARKAVAIIGHKEQKTPFEIMAEVLDKDRTSFYYYVNKADKTFAQDKPFRDTYLSILKKYKKIDSELNIFADKRDMKEFLLRNGVKETKNNYDFFIRVTSGDISVDISTTYFDYLDQEKKIKLALIDYKYTYKIYYE
tara:strand:- start:1424 stop:1960 length:537 start_codon:yes stop_codon:yes gene_type:complete